MRLRFSTFLFFLLLLPGFSSAQQEAIDRLRQQFLNASNDTIRLNTSKQLFGQYVYTQVDSAIFFANEIVTIGLRLKSDKEVLTGNNYLGIAYTIKGDYSQAADYMKETLRHHTASGDSVNMAYSFNNLGINYTYAGDYLKAAENLIASARLKETLVRGGKSKAEVDLASTIMNIGVAYQSQLDIAQAKTYYLRAIAEGEEADNGLVAAQSRVGLGNILVEQEKFAEALTMLEEAESVLIEKNDMFSLGKLYNNMTLAYAGLDNGASIVIFANKAIENNKIIGNAQSEALGYVYLGLGYLKTQQYRKAIDASNRALTYGEEQAVNDVKFGALRNLSETYAAMGNYKRAYDYGVQYKAVDEEVFAAQRSEQIERLSAQYEADKREIEIDNLNQETQLKSLQLSKANSERSLLFVLIGALVVIVLLIAWFYRKIIESRKTLQVKNNELDKLNSTKDRFFAIISHDIRGHISAFRGNGKLLKYLMSKNEKEKLEKVTEEIDKNAHNLGELLDNLLHWSMDQLQGYEPKPESIQLARVVDELMENYQPLAVAKGVELKSEIASEVVVSIDLNGLSVILRNLLANAIKFTTEGEVTISYHSRNTEQEIKVKDTGIGIPQAIQEQLFAIGEDKIRRGTRNEKGTGLGLNLAHEFAVANGGRLEVNSAEGQGTTFSLYLVHV